MRPVLILDGGQRSALAATRSLGRRGIPVIVGHETTASLAGSSRFAERCWRYSSPDRRPECFLDELQEFILRESVDVVLPMGDVTTYLLARLRSRCPKAEVRIPIAAFGSFDMLADKWRLYSLAQSLGVTVPRTVLLEGANAMKAVTATLQFPVVVKPRRSRVERADGWIAAPVRYARSVEQLEAIVAAEQRPEGVPLLVQEFVEGTGQGIFTLYSAGEPLCFFAHRRLRERPPSGGVSVLSESIAVDPEMCRLARRVLDEARWHGVAMVEFEVSADGRPYLLEVNGRFWGSLQLAIDAGVDFPYLLYQVARGVEPEVPRSYRVGIKSRWLLGDADRLYMELFKRDGGRLSAGEACGAVLEFLRLFDRSTLYDVNRRGDLGPFVHELWSYVAGGPR